MAKIKAYCKDFWRYRFLLQNLVSRDFKLKYRRSVLGVVWSVLNPLLMMLVMWAVFSNVFRLGSEEIINFPVYLLIGQLLYSFFNEATTNAMSSVLYAAPLIKKVYIPKYIFPLQKVCSALVNCLLSFIALLLVMLLTGAKLYWTFPLLVYPLGTLAVFSLGVGLLLAASTVFFRDVMHMWSVFTIALMYFSAIFYSPSCLPGWLQQLLNLNPIYWYITAFRQVVLYGKLLTLNMVLVCGGCALAALAIGLLFFRRQQDKFVLHI